MSDIRAVIARLEAATEGSRELDGDIYEALGYRVKRSPDVPKGWRHRTTRAWAFLRDSRWESIRHLTTSLDAALTLVPEGYSWEIAHSPYGNASRATVWDSRAGLTPGFSSHHKDEILAACIAALRARAHE